MTIKLRIAIPFLIVAIVCCASSAFAAKKGCCSHHGGPGACTAAGVYQCTDGSTSGCKCDAPAATQKSAPKASTEVTTTTSTAKTKTAAATGGGACCKHCTTGKPCGDSCISASQTCHKTGGCAC